MMNRTRYDKFHETWLKLATEGVSFLEISRRYKCQPTTVANRVRLLAGQKGVYIKNAIVNKRPKTVSEAFFNKALVKDGCWGWSGYKTGTGYGQFMFNYKTFLAHIVSYKIHKGEVGNKFVCHSCDNPICSNPEHLFLGTQSDNMVDARDKGRSTKAVLTPKIVSIIKRELLVKNDNKAQKALARKYGVGICAIYCIKTERTWKQIKAASLSN